VQINYIEQRNNFTRKKAIPEKKRQKTDAYSPLIERKDFGWLERD